MRCLRKLKASATEYLNCWEKKKIRLILQITRDNKRNLRKWRSQYVHRIHQKKARFFNKKARSQDLLHKGAISVITRKMRKKQRSGHTGCGWSLTMATIFPETTIIVDTFVASPYLRVVFSDRVTNWRPTWLTIWSLDGHYRRFCSVLVVICCNLLGLRDVTYGYIVTRMIVNSSSHRASRLL